MKALVVGIGGLGCPAAIVLARAGVEVIGIADDDLVDVTNLHRQILFDERDVGRSKVQAAARRLAAIAPAVRVVTHETRLLPQNAIELVSAYDVVVEGSDNFATKFLAADAAAIAKKPIVHGAAVRWHGTALAVGAEGGPATAASSRTSRARTRRTAPRPAWSGRWSAWSARCRRISRSRSSAERTSPGRSSPSTARRSRRAAVAFHHARAACSVEPRGGITDIDGARYAAATCEI